MKQIITTILIVGTYTFLSAQEVVQINDSLYQIVNEVQNPDGSFLKEGSPFLKKEQVKEFLFRLAIQKNTASANDALPDVSSELTSEVLDAIQGDWTLTINGQKIESQVSGDTIRAQEFEGRIHVLNKEEFLIRGLFDADAIINYRKEKGKIGNVEFLASNNG